MLKCSEVCTISRQSAVYSVFSLLLCFVMRNNQLNSLTDCDVITENYLKAQLHGDICS